MAVKIKINQHNCKSCGLCVDACPKKNLRVSEQVNAKGYFPVVVIDPARCSGCGMCYLVCPDVCITIERQED